ncbi:MAG: putative bifunctional diguanylate cyclase/phosphodiesterase [Prochlorococcaceae cyanobacterium]
MALLAMAPLLVLESGRQLRDLRQALRSEQQLGLDLAELSLRNTSRTVFDWAHWERSWNYLAGRNPAFLSEDLGTTSLFDDGGVMVLLDSSGRQALSYAQGGADQPRHRSLVACARENQRALVTFTSLHQLACRDEAGNLFLGAMALVTNNDATAPSQGALALFTPLIQRGMGPALVGSMQQLEQSLQPAREEREPLRLNGAPLQGPGSTRLALEPPNLVHAVLERTLELALPVLAGLGGLWAFRIALLSNRRRERLHSLRIERQARHTIRRSIQELDRLVSQLELPIPEAGPAPPGDALAAIAGRVERMLQACNVLASLDPLTGLPNRRTFLSRLAGLLAAAPPARAPLALLLVDIDRFGGINESYGHAKGDLTLQAVAARLRSLVGSSGFLARYGGDEFVVLIDGSTLPDDEGLRSQSLRLAERISTSFESSAQMHELGLGVSLSLSISLAEPGERDGEALLQRLGSAMAEAKSHHHLRLPIFEHGGVSRSPGAPSGPGGYQLYNDLREAIQRHQLGVAFQPIVDPERRILAVEALGRWRHPEHGEVPADLFLAITEQFRLTGEIGFELLQLTLASYAELRRRSSTEIRLCLNVTPSLLSDPGYVPGLRRALAEHGLSAEWITVEITEGAILEASDVVNTSLQQLRQLGIRLSLDDFGTGFSSLSLLSRLQPQEVKIDKSFVAALLSDPYARQIVRLIADMASSMDLEVVAEGVEDEITFHTLLELGIRRLQGYHFSRPLPLEELIACHGHTPEPRERDLATGSVSAPP